MQKNNKTTNKMESGATPMLIKCPISEKLSIINKNGLQK